MRKIFVSILLMLSVIVLAACGNQTTEVNMDGEYLSYFPEFSKPLSDSVDLTIQNNTLTWHYSKKTKFLFIIDKEKQTLTGGYDNRTVPYTFENGKLTTQLNSASIDYYLVDSPAYKELLKEIDK